MASSTLPLGPDFPHDARVACMADRLGVRPDCWGDFLLGPRGSAEVVVSYAGSYLYPNDWNVRAPGFSRSMPADEAVALVKRLLG